MRTRIPSTGLRLVVLALVGTALPGACSVEDKGNFVFAASGGSGGQRSGGGRTGAGAAGESGEAGAPEGGDGGVASGTGGRASGGSTTGGRATGNSGGASSGGRATAEGGSAGQELGGNPGLVDEPRECALSLLQGTGSPLVKASTKDGTDSQKGSCGSGTGNDVVYDWVAPATDYYSINTAGSSIDTVLYALDACGGKELACNNNTGSSPQSEILQRFEKDQRVLLVVDGNSGAQGDIQLNSERITCPDTELTGQPLPATLSTVGGTNAHKGACGGDALLERSYHWTVPQTGTYQITASSTEFVPSLYVERGPRCGGELLGCRQAAGKTSMSFPAQVGRSFTAGQVVNLIVDGGAGFFTLDAKRIDAGTTCGTAPLPGEGKVLLKGSGPAAPVSQSCAPAGGINGVGSGPFPFSSVTYKLESKQVDIGSCTYRVTATKPIVVSLIKGACTGPETICKPSTLSGSEHVAEFSLGVPENGVYTLLIQNTSLMQDVEFSLAVYCIA